MWEFPFIQSSVFTDEKYKFSGNQLATFWDRTANKHLSTDEMLGIAREMNFSETTFVLETKMQSCSVKVRIFTPGQELNFAGHPTLGTAYILKDQAIIAKDLKETQMELGIGPIKVEYNTDNTISMYQAQPKFLDKYKDKEKIAQILGINPKDILDSSPMQAVSTGFPFLLVPVRSLEVIQNINVDTHLLINTLKKFISDNLLVFTLETVHNDSSVHARMFAPSAGVNEDPATGSAAGPLGAYLEHYNVPEKHIKSSLIRIEQGFEINRPSLLLVKNLYKDADIINVVVSGKVKKVAESTFFL